MALGRADGSIIINTKILEAGFDKGMSSIKNKLGGFGRFANNTLGKTADTIDNRINSAMDRTADKVKKIGALVASAFAIGKLIGFAKEAIELGSDLAEVENVTSTVFPNMSRDVDEWANSALDAFGLTRTMAKNYVGTFGAMSKAFGFSERKAYEMSTALAGLSGDVASFYNLSQDEAFTKLKSIFTGETESLKSLGVVMTQTALDQYALANGFGKTTANMTEQEKVSLRLAFVTEKLGAAAGDFTKTQDSWANQTKILSARFTELKTAIGQGLINLFTPIIKGINTLLSYLYTAAEAFNTFTATLMGKSRSGGGGVAGSGGGGVVQAASDTAQAIGDVADNTAGAADATDDYAGAAKKAQKAARGYLSTLDEVNKFTSDIASDADSSSSPKSGKSTGGSGKSGSGSPAAGLESIYDPSNFAVDEMAEPLSEFAQKLRDAFLAGDWEGLGRIIGQKINEVMAKIKDAISWDNVGPAITKFVDAFTRTFNSLVSTINWHLIGETFATGINTIVYTLLLLVKGINWNLLGMSFAKGINGVIDELDWKAYGALLGERFMIMWRMFLGFVFTLDWEKLGESIKTSIYSALDHIDMDEIFLAMSGFGTGLALFLNNLIDPELFEKVAEKIVEGLNAELAFLDEFGKHFNFTNFGDSIAAAINKVFTDFDFVKLGKVVFLYAKNIFGTLKDVIGKINWTNIGISIIETIWAAISGEEMDDETKKKALASFTELESTLQTIASFTFTALEDFYNNFLKPLATWALGTGLPELASILSESLNRINWDSINEGLEVLWGILEPFAEAVGEGLIGFFEKLANVVGFGISLTLGIVNGALGLLGETIDGQNSVAIEAVGKALGVLLGAIVTYKISSAIYTGISNLASYLPGLLTAIVAHPAVTIAACGLAIGTAIYEITKNTKSQNRKDIEDTAAAIKQLNDEMTKVPTGADADAQYAETLLDKYLELNKKLVTTGNLDESEQTLFEYYHDELVSYCGEMVNYIGDVGEAYTGTRGELEALINKQKEHALTVAYLEIYAEYAKEVATQQIQMKESVNRLKEAYAEAGGQMDLFTDENLAAWVNYLDNGADSLEGLSDETVSFVAFLMDHYTDAVDDATMSLWEANSSIVEANGSMAIIEQNIKSLSENTEVSASEFANLDESVTETTDNMGKSFNSHKDDAASFLRGLKEGAEGQVGSALHVFTELAGSVKKGFADEWGLQSGTSTVAAEQGSAYVQGAEDGVEKKKPSLWESFKAMAKGSSKAYSDELGISNGSSAVMEKAGESTVTGISTGSEDKKSDLLRIFEELPGGMVRIMGDLTATFRKVGGSIISGTKLGIMLDKRSLLSDLTALSDAMIGKFDTLNARMWAVGHNAAQSLANGFRSVHIPRPVFGVGTQWSNVAGTIFPVPAVSVTWMANGGVIPRNASRFLAGLGDNNHETEVVSPLSTIKQAVNEALLGAGMIGNNGGNSKPLKIQIDGRTVFDAVINEAKSRQDRTGYNPFDL